MSQESYKSVPKAHEKRDMGHGTPRARKGKWDIVPSHFVSRDTVPLSQQQRFAGWLAGATEEQVKRWESMQQRAAVVEGE